ncbi:metal ABC transporter solute-binding protein, Zn/Mn family [Microbacterium lemovicicum]|uniref:metal ABC transporter solute-binding protein, Zn/Mn family n=1 Tax=Microbacterium lemovicicum TaxID=1072463 RepID=UPI000F8C62F0|nr:zinc ABC transporter substrate-binding protein [Microbacterium lemovicicum]
MFTRRALATAALGAASVLALAGCAGAAGSASTGGSDVVRIVASTNVYGQIAQEIGGDAVEVTSLVTSGAQDPHSYEATAQDQLALSRADLVIENGAGYDAFVEALLEAAGTSVPTITAVEYSHSFPGNEGHDDDATATPTPDTSGEAEAEADGHDHAEGDGHDHIEGFNEHVWYDPHTVEHVAEAIADELSTIAPEHADDFAANAAAFVDGIAGLESSLADIAAKDAGAGVFVTEPVPVYLMDAAELTDVTPPEFSESVEEGQDVPPSTLLESLDLIDGGTVRVLIANAQTGGGETTQVIDAAKAKDIPVLEFTETLPEGDTYLQWMQKNIEDLAGALGE